MLSDVLTVLVPLFYMVGCGIASALIAKTKERRDYLWFLIGCVLGVFGVILISMASNPVAEQEREKELAEIRAQLSEIQFKLATELGEGDSACASCANFSATHSICVVFGRVIKETVLNCNEYGEQGS